jgi:hypothetical protein
VVVGVVQGFVYLHLPRLLKLADLVVVVVLVLLV